MNLLHVNDRPGEYPPSWYAESAAPLPPCPPLAEAVRADVCVVGGGYTGLSAALHLAQGGVRVVLLEAQLPGFGASGRNGGQLGSGQRLEPPELEAQFGLETARALWRIGEDAKAKVRDLIAAHGIACDLTPGVAHAERRGQDKAAAEAFCDHMARAYGYESMAPLDRDGIAAATGSGVFAGGIIDHGAAHLHPLRFALGLARAAQDAGAVLHGLSEVVRLTRGDPVTVETANGRVTADHAILACNGYLGRLAPEIARRVMPINNFICATAPLGSGFPEILPGNIAVADSRFVVRYWRLSADRRLLFGGGESYGYRFPDDIAKPTRKAMLEIYPQLHAVPITHAWGGTLAITRSRLPHFTRIAPNVLSASGYSGHGIALATLAGALLAEAVTGPSERFETMARLPAPTFPGGTALRAPLLAAAMSWYALRDRIGL